MAHKFTTLEEFGSVGLSRFHKTSAAQLVGKIVPRYLTSMAGKSVGLSAGSSSEAIGPVSGWISSQKDGWVSKANVPKGPAGSCESSYGPALEVPEYSSTAFYDQAPPRQTKI